MSAVWSSGAYKYFSWHDNTVPTQPTLHESTLSTDPLSQQVSATLVLWRPQMSKSESTVNINYNNVNFNLELLGKEDTCKAVFLWSVGGENIQLH